MRGGTLGGLAGRGREYVVWQLAGLRAAQGKFRACRAGRGLINPSPVPSARRSERADDARIRGEERQRSTVLTPEEWVGVHRERCRRPISP